jgi:hypothetical protein
MIFLLYLSIPIGIDPVETNEAGSRRRPSGTWKAATTPISHPQRACSVGWWLMAGADLF